jgi:hypothetical protein
MGDDLIVTGLVANDTAVPTFGHCARRCRKACGTDFCGHCAAKKERFFDWWSRRLHHGRGIPQPAVASRG